MTTRILPRADQAQPLPAHFRRLYRCHVQPQHCSDPEVTAFVSAASREMAVRKITQAICAFEFGSTPESVAERCYNCSSTEELIAEGLSEDHVVRLFETGWSGNRAASFVQSPLVLLADPGPLLRAWAQLPQPTID